MATTGSSEGAAKKANAPDAKDYEVLKGVYRAHRTGPMVRHRVGNGTPEQIRKNQLQILRDSPKPGEKEYNIKTDPVIPDSQFRDVVAAELRATDGKKSPTWDALRSNVEAEYKALA